MMHRINDTNLANLSVHFPGVELRLRTDLLISYNIDMALDLLDTIQENRHSICRKESAETGHGKS